MSIIISIVYIIFCHYILHGSLNWRELYLINKTAASWNGPNLSFTDIFIDPPVIMNPSIPWGIISFLSTFMIEPRSFSVLFHSEGPAWLHSTALFWTALVNNNFLALTRILLAYAYILTTNDIKLARRGPGGKLLGPNREARSAIVKHRWS